MHYRYIPILRWKRGERAALKSLSNKATADVIPLIIVTEETFKGIPEKITQEGVSAPELFAFEIHKNWGLSRFYLDASLIPPAARGIHPLLAAAKRCRELGATLIPATTLGASPSYEAAVMQVSQTDKRGVALRVSLREFSSVSNWIGSWPHDLGDTDLIVDLADKVTTIADLGSSLDHTFVSLHKGAKWRTVTTSGTSMPENFAGRDVGVFTIERAEWSIWLQLIQLSLPYRLDYGDYATVPLIPAPAAVKWGFPINVRYTLPTQFLICRGVTTTREGAVDMDVQLIGHAKSIVKYKKRAPLDCWADRTIDRIAAEEESPGNLETWTKIGVSRHIEVVRVNTP